MLTDQINIQVIYLMVKEMEKEDITIQMVTHIQATGLMAKNMGKERITLLMVTNI